eukprot:2634041-Amphidinium_carterae.1
MAASEAHDKEQKRQEEIEHLYSALYLHRTRQDAEVANAGMPCLMSNCRLNDDAKRRLADCFQNLGAGDKTKWLLEAKASIISTTSLPQNHIHHLEAFDVPNFQLDRPTARAQGWAKTIATHRERFQDAVLEFRYAENSRFYVLHYALKSPQMLVMSPLIRTETEWPMYDLSNVLQQGHMLFEYEFELENF